MSSYTKSIKCEFEFEGDKVNITMGRMNRKDAMSLMPFFGDPGPDGKIAMNFTSQMEMLDAASDLLPKYIKSMTGLKDEDGEDISIKTICEEAYFLNLISEIIAELVDASFLTEKKVKKSHAQPAKTIQEDDALVSLTSEG